MKRTIIPYHPKLKELARQLRNNSTKSEIKLWFYLKNKKMMGYDFHRQKPIGNFIVDFFCIELMLAIELDGLSHSFEEVFEKDLIKTDFLKSIDVHLLRFNDYEVMNDIDNVIRAIEHTIELIQEKNNS